MRVLLADSQYKVRYAMRVLLEQQPDVNVVGESGAYADLIVSLTLLMPDVVLLDWDLPGLPHEQLDSLRRAAPNLRIIALSSRPEARQAALAAGADAFTCKTFPPERLLNVLQPGARPPEQHGMNPLAGQ